jgi:hypothetical protein
MSQRAIKIQCPECREIVSLERFTTDREGLHFECAECGRVNLVANADNLPGAAATADPAPAATAGAAAAAGADGIMCPKCGHTQTGGQSCHRCGLDFLRFDPANLPQPPPGAAELWSAIEARPDDADQLQRFVDLCAEHDRLDFASRQARILARQPGGAAAAAQLQARIAALAQARLAAIAPSPAVDEEDKKQRSRVVWWVLLLVALGALGYLVYTASEKMGRFI